MIRITNRRALGATFLALLLAACESGDAGNLQDPASADGQDETAPAGGTSGERVPRTRTVTDLLVTSVDELDPEIVAEYAEKYEGYTKEELKVVYDGIEEALTLEKNAELEARHSAGLTIDADRHPQTGAPVWPKAIPSGVFFQSRTEPVVGEPESKKKAWFTYLPVEEFEHLYVMREELVWLKSKFGRPKKAPDKP